MVAARRLRFGQFRQHGERLDHGGAPDLRAPDVAIAALAVDQPAVARGGGEMHQPHRLAWYCAARASNAGDRHGDVGRGMGQRPLRHRLRGLPAHRAAAREHCGRDAEHLLLGLVGVGDEATLEHVRRAGHLGQRPSYEPAGARLRGRDTQLPAAAECQQRFGLGEQLAVNHRAALPAPRQAHGGIGEGRHAFAAAGEAHLLAGGGLHADAVDRNTGELGDARTGARIASRCGPIFGPSQTMVRSR